MDSRKSDYIIVPMSQALSKTERFLKVGPYVLWFSMHAATSLVLVYERGVTVTIYYLITYVFFGTLIIWTFGYQLFPKYLVRGGKIDREMGLLLGANIILFIIGIYAHTLTVEILGLNKLKDQYAPKSVRIILWVLMVFLAIFYRISTRIARVYYLNALLKLEHKAQRVEAELKLLKSQISPHFLFNTLNNIYGLAYLRDERAAVMISKLSKLLRYLLYDCDQPRVRLSKEKELIDNFLSIQLLKHEDGQNVDFYHAGIGNKHKIAPMILINFIENCFKHSDLEINPEGWIKISLEVDNGELSFRTENTVKEVAEDTQMNHGGIGLTNSLKLLEANYPDKHQIDMTQVGNVYQLNLNMIL